MAIWRAEPCVRHCAQCARLFVAVVVANFFFAGSQEDAALASVPFTEESTTRGLVFSTPYGPLGSLPYGRGLAWADLDGDGDADLVTTGAADKKLGLFENVGGSFTNHYSTSGIPPFEVASGVVAFDFDGDGDLDLFVTQWTRENKLLRNDGNFTFTDVSAQAHVDLIDAGTGPTVGDYDGDGWLDLFVSCYGSENHLYRNNGDATFTDVSAAAGISGIYNTLQSAFFDMDGDGDKDLYISNDKRSPYNEYEHNRLYENVGGAFVEISASSGADINIMSMNIGLADLDHNGYLDIYCTNVSMEPLGLYQENVLLMNAGNGVFSEQQLDAGVASYLFGWGAVFFDYDNNFTQDLYICNQFDENSFYVNSGVWPLTETASQLAVDLDGDSRCVAVADIDDDGDIDMVIQKYEDNIHLYINHEGENRNWLRVVPVGLLPNRQSIGAVVRARSGSLWQMQELVAGSNYKVQNELVAHFGMNNDATVDEVTIEWYDGATRTLTALPTNHVYHVYHPGLLGDLNEDGVVDAIDAGAFVNALLVGQSPRAGCFDFNGNGALDGGDIQGMVDRLIGAA